MVQYRLKLLGQWRAFQRVLCVCVLSRFSCVWFFATLWTVAHQALCPGEPYVSIIIREMLSHVDSLQWKEIFKAYDLLRYLPSVLSGWLIKFKHIIGLKINHEFLYLEGISHIFSWPCLCLHEQKEMEMAFLWFIYKAPSAFTDFFELQSLFSDLKAREELFPLTLQVVSESALQVTWGDQQVYFGFTHKFNRTCILTRVITCHSNQN